MYTKAKIPMLQNNRQRWVVRDLTMPIINSERNVTCDNFFTDVNLALKLLKKNLIILGTLKKK